MNTGSNSEEQEDVGRNWLSLKPLKSHIKVRTKELNAMAEEVVLQ